MRLSALALAFGAEDGKQVAVLVPEMRDPVGGGHLVRLADERDSLGG